MPKALEDKLFEPLAERPRPADDDIRFEPVQRRVRVMLGGVTIADSRKVMLMLENRRLAVYYFPVNDVRTDLLVPTSYRSQHAGKGEASFYDVKVGEKVADTAGWGFLAPERFAYADSGGFCWGEMGAWFGAGDAGFAHPPAPS